ncbi:Protein of unknown function [Tangfeifania diversioriginum]|jgi:heme-binding NEAT domain protein|uniref:DUF2442 domain-containing protein n=1 Tax=Tangfeifania diversioriginum TaxID=1168035 RepID=A0A1M6B3N6_9BACT|nr:DUF2442 domain-containing protein [Tangfeifania diversioriginum]SHI43277.1 Protein of unknown function [Tangfeifania diversioriginum]
MKIVEEPIVDYQIKIAVTGTVILDNYKLQITFNDETKTIVDFESFLKNSQHPAIKKYLDKTNFRNFEIVDGNINWNDYDMIFPVEDLKKGQIS